MEHHPAWRLVPISNWFLKFSILTHHRKSDPYSRLRVPKYQKVFEAFFFLTFLALYYAVLIERNPRHITAVETLLYIWIAAFAYDESGEWKDAGTLLYAADFWSLWDLGIIGVGIAFLVASGCSLQPREYKGRLGHSRLPLE